MQERFSSVLSRRSSGTPGSLNCARAGLHGLRPATRVIDGAQRLGHGVERERLVEVIEQR